MPMAKDSLLYPTLAERIDELKRLRALVASSNAAKKARAHVQYREACERHAPALWQALERKMKGGDEL